ncbi:MAG: hypothetical protein V2A74_06745, partial [bacterium]
MRPLRPAFHRVPIRLTLLLLVTTLLLFNLGAWYQLKIVEQSQERALAERLLSIGASAEVTITGETFPVLDFPASFLERVQRGEEPGGFFGWQNLDDAIKGIAAKNHLRRVTVFDPESLTVIADAASSAGLTVTPGRQDVQLELDEPEIDKAAAGTPATPILYFYGGRYYKRSYSPLRDSRDKIVALLRLEASADYFSELNRARNRLSGVALIAS